MLKHLIVTLVAGINMASAMTYQEKDGLIVIEPENTTSPLDKWQPGTSIRGFSGKSYLEFSGNGYQSGTPKSPLEFKFTIKRAGFYFLHLHCARERKTIDGEVRNDVANDCFVRVEGNFGSGPNPGTSHGDDAPLSMLESDTKFFGGNHNSFMWAAGNRLDPGGHKNKRRAVYNFNAGETYNVVISGRSKAFKLNRIVFRHDGVSTSAAQRLSLPESDTTGGSGTHYTYSARDDFSDIDAGAIPFRRDAGNDALEIDASNLSYRDKFARAHRTFDGVSGRYEVNITTLMEEAGESTYRLLVNGGIAANYTNPFIGPGSAKNQTPHIHSWPGIPLANGDTIAIESNTHTNRRIQDGGGTAWARGRWRQIDLKAGSPPPPPTVAPPAGRLAVVADGNSPDPDDIGATAVLLGLLKGSGLQERLVHLSHSCDLDPFANPGSQKIDATNELRRQRKLHDLCGEGIEFFGPFDNLTDYFNCRRRREAAVEDLRNAINASSADDPLWIVEAGEPDIIGSALDAATTSKREFVHVISHHPANDNSGDSYTWAQILAFGVTEHQIGDQNVGLQTAPSPWDWAENHSNTGIAWIWDQLDYAEKDGVVRFQDNKFDCSDAGMIYWWISGADDGGNRNSSPTEMRSLLLRDPEASPAH